MKKLSSITLWVIFIVTIVLTGMFFGGATEEVPTATGTTESPVNLDLFLQWNYVVVGVVVVALLLYASAQIFSMFKYNPKGAIAPIGTFVAFFALLGICHSISDSGGYYAVVNGTAVTY